MQGTHYTLAQKHHLLTLRELNALVNWLALGFVSEHPLPGVLAEVVKVTPHKHGNVMYQEKLPPAPPVCEHSKHYRYDPTTRMHHCTRCPAVRAEGTEHWDAAVPA